MKFGLKDKKRLIAVLIAVITMGLSLSFLIRVDFGTDPCSTLNLGVANQLGISFGTWQVIFNALLFVIVIVYDRSQIGWGTLANMLLIGYSVDFFTWLFNKFISADLFNNFMVRIIVLIPTLIIFIIAAAVYMAVELGAAPYDATVFIIASKVKKIPFRFIRMAWDIAAALIGFLLGSTIGIVTVVMAFALGPVISLVKAKIDKYL
mgnify:CR=1 FL=1